MTERLQFKRESLIEAFRQEFMESVAKFLETNYPNQNTAAAYKSDLIFFGQFLRDKEIKDWLQIKPELLEEFLNQQQKESSPSLTNRRTSAARCFLRWLAQNHYHLEQSALQSPVIELNRVNTRLTSKQLEKISEKGDLRDRALIYLLRSGVRVSEISKLTIGDLGIKIDEGGKTTFQIKSPKGDPIILDEPACQAIISYLKDRKGSINSQSPLIHHQSGGNKNLPITRQGVWFRFKNLAERVGIPFTPQCITKLAQKTNVQST